MGAEDDGWIYGKGVWQPDIVDVGFTGVQDEDRFQHNISGPRQLARQRHIGVQSSKVQHGGVSRHGQASIASHLSSIVRGFDVRD